jgi:hypothetical protein
LLDYLGCTPFRLRNKEYLHVAEGYCVRQVTYGLSGGTEVAWRVYYGPVQPGSAHPVILHAAPGWDGEEYADYDTLELAVQAVRVLHQYVPFVPHKKEK